jgi:hypothetical protein
MYFYQSLDLKIRVSAELLLSYLCPRYLAPLGSTPLDGPNNNHIEINYGVIIVTGSQPS